MAKSLILILLFCSYSYASEKAVCRIVSHGPTTNVGTGTFVKKTKQGYLILTCGHVIADGIFFSINVFNDSKKSMAIPAKLKFSSFAGIISYDDLALLEIRDKDLRGYVPDVIEIASELPSKDDKVYGYGFPGGRWVQRWDGRVIEILDENIFFDAIPTPGQSGSAILTLVNGKPRIVGMILWTFPDRGGGSHIVSIRSLL